MNARELARTVGAAVVALSALGAAEIPETRSGRTPDTTGSGHRALSAPTTSIPVHFEANRGQTDPSVRFVARGRGFRAFFTDAETVFVMQGPTGTDAVRMRFEGAAAATPRAEGPLPGRSHYLLGADPSKWVTGVEHFAGIGTPELYHGVRLNWRGLEGGRLEYDLLLDPGADAAAIRLRFEGADSVEVDPSGDLLVKTRRGVLRHGKPVARQGTTRVEAAFAPGADGGVGIRLGAHDPGRPLLIDPVVQYATYLGGSLLESGSAIAADPAGAPVVSGQTYSLNFPTQAPVQAAHGADSGSADAADAYVTRFNAAGNALVFSTYLGGNYADLPRGVAVDSTGAVYVVGSTQSTDFPLKNAYQGTRKTQSPTGFLSKLAPAGSSLVYSTYLGGNGSEDIYAIVVDASGAAYLTGQTQSTNFPTMNPFQGVLAGGILDVFVAKMNAAGSALVWSSFLGGAGTDYGTAIALGPTGDVFVTGYTDSTAFPTTNPYQATKKGPQDAFITRVAADGASKVWSTYLGGTADDFGGGIAVDQDGSAWVTGLTYSADFPLQGGLGITLGSGKAFVTKFAPDGATLAASTFLGGSGFESGTGIAIDAGGSACVTGFTNSANFPVLSPIQATIGGNTDAFVANILPSGNALGWATFLGGSAGDTGRAIAVGANGRVLVAGTAFSSNFPTVFPYQGTTGGGGGDAFVVSILGDLYPPGNVKAILVGLTAIQLNWIDRSGTETGFRVERKVGAGAFSVLATLPANTTVLDDNGLTPETTYTYRVTTFNLSNDSPPSEEASATTPATPATLPGSPTGLDVQEVSPREVALAWVDNSDDEDFFSVSRATGPGLFVTKATPFLGVTSYRDLTVLPEVTYSWKVRAQNPVGPSLFFSNIATLTMSSTLDIQVASGKITDKPDIRKDTVIVAGNLGYGPDALVAAFDPQTQSFAVRLGDMGTPSIFDIQPGDPGWKTKKTRHTWKSPKGALAKVKVVIDAATGAYKVKAAMLTLPAALSNPVRITVTSGTDTGHAEAPWTLPTKTGLIKFPVPVPK